MKNLIVIVLALCLIGVASATVNSSTVLYLPMNDSFVDYSQYGHTTTTSGATAINTTVKQFGAGSGFFNGINSNVTSPDSSDWFFQQGNVSIGMWVNRSSYKLNYVVEQFESGTKELGFLIDESTLEFYSYNTTYQRRALATVTIPKNQWTYILYVDNGTRSILYVNGTELLLTSHVHMDNYTDFAAPLEIASRNGGSFFDGDIDDLVIINGFPLDGTKVPTREFLTNPNALISQSATYGGTPLAVTFTNASLGNQQTVFNWSFTNLTYSTPTYFGSTYNPSYTFTAAGNYSILLNVTNPFGTSSNTSWVNVTEFGFKQQDIWMSQNFILILHVTDSVTGLPIPTVQAKDQLGNTYTTTNGTFIITYPYTTAIIALTATGYASKYVSYVMDADREETTTMVAESTSSTSTWYTPHQVRIAVVDQNGIKLPGMTVNATVIANTFPESSTGNWLEQLYGINPAIANDMLNGTLVMEGVTGGDGSTTFTMHSSIGYAINIRNTSTGVSQTTDLQPIDTLYTIWLQGSLVNNSYYQMGYNQSLYATANLTYVTMHMNYTDMSGLTTNLIFKVIAKVNNTEIYNTSFSGFGRNFVYTNYSVPNVRGQAYTWYYDARRVL